MTTDQITEILIRAANGGNYTSDMKWDIPYVQALLDSVREQAIKISYNGSRTIAAQKVIQTDWVQTHTYTNFTKVEPKNEPTYLTTKALSAISIDQYNSGAIYIGTEGGTYQFKEAGSRGEIATWYALGVFKTGKVVGVLRTGEVIEVHGNSSLKSLTEDAAYQKPSLVSGWNYNTSQYPINEGMIPLIKDLFLQQVRLELMIPKDTVVDRVETKK